MNRCTVTVGLMTAVIIINFFDEFSESQICNESGLVGRFGYYLGTRIGIPNTCMYLRVA